MANQHVKITILKSGFAGAFCLVCFIISIAIGIPNRYWDASLMSRYISVMAVFAILAAFYLLSRVRRAYRLTEDCFYAVRMSMALVIALIVLLQSMIAVGMTWRK